MTQHVLLYKTWRAIVTQVAPKLTGLFDNLFDDYGVTGICAIFDNLSSALINNEDPGVIGRDIATSLDGLSLHDKLLLLRFGKRYTKLEYSPAEEKAILDKFIGNDNRIKLFDRRGIPTWLRELLHSISESFWRPVPSNLLRFDPFRDMPTGMTAEGLRNGFEKYLYYSTTLPEGDRHGFMVELSEDAKVEEDIAASRLVFVPKNYKTPRLICEEPLLRQIRQTPISKALRYELESKKGVFHPGGRVDLTDQSRNQELAMVGSRDRSLCTIDLSNASDSLSYSVLEAVLPRHWANAVFSNMSTLVKLPNGKTRTLHIPCTMGARVTFPVETLVFWVIVCAAAQIASAADPGAFKKLDSCAVYGDDIIAPSEWYDVIVDLLTLCGFTVNAEKSFTGDHPYRESCGKEYYCGEEVSTIYWPRRDLQLRNGDIPSLVKLANRLYSEGLDLACGVVTAAIDDIMPGVPRIEPYSDKLGIWDVSPSRRFAPYVGGYIATFYSMPRTQSAAQNIRLAHRVASCLCDVEVDSRFMDVVDTEIVLTYNNSKLTIPEFFSGLTRQLVPSMFERYEYERWLALGSTYYDPLCELLHVTQPSRIGRRMVPSAYVIARTSYLGYDPTPYKLI